jgi:uncharacterized repeat protein (TIGR01451 family)
MKVRGWSVRATAQVLALCCAMGAGAGVGKAQSAAITATVSPTDLSFGIPTGSSPAVSAAQTVTVNLAGNGPVTFGAAATGSSAFTITGNSCTGTINAPNACQVSVTFSSTSTALQTATLTIASSAAPGVISVPMNGAFGAIELFAALNVNPSLFSGVTWPNSAGNPVKSAPVTLSCPAPPIKAVLSSTPDGSANVFQDNTIQFANSINGDTTTTLNVCAGGDPQFQGFTGFPAGTTNCFQPAYETAAQNYMGQNPDLATVPVAGAPAGSFVATFGVPPVDVSGLLVAGSQNVTVTLEDAGGDLGAATVHLVTNCTLAGVTAGGSITGNPVTNDPSSQTQTFAFDNGGGQNVSFITSTSVAQQSGTVTIPSGTVPIVTDIGIPQQLFTQLVNGKSAAPAVCLRLTGETDKFNQPMCKAYLIQCKDPNGSTITGDNCVPTASTARNLFDEAQFSSPDAPDNGTNYLSTACTFFLDGSLTGPDRCATSNPTGSSPMLIGPGMLLGSDNWTCAPGATNPCTPLEPDTSMTAATYFAGNCSLTGTLGGDTCPLDTLTQFKGAADPIHGSTTNGKNSVFIPVVNMPLPVTQASVANLTHGWLNALNSSASVKFISNAANYIPSTMAPLNPGTNGFTAAPPYSITYGITPVSSPVPDTTFPVPTDTTLLNSGANPDFKAPLCTSAPSTFTTNTVLNPGTGIFNLHYFTTDCALTEELLFNPTGTQLTDPTANWASFRILSFGVDTNPPSLACATVPAAPTGTNGWFTTAVTGSCTANDIGSGFAPGSAVPNTDGTVLQGSLTESFPITATNGVIPQQTVMDLAGNQSNTQGPFNVFTDLVAPTITGTFTASGTTFTVGQTVTLKYTCGDTGSGLANCGGQVIPMACPLAPSVGTTTFTTPVGIPIDTTVGAAGPHTINTSAVDCAGNMKPLTLNYNVVFGSADLLVVTLVSPSVKTGSNLTYNIGVLNLGPSVADNVTVTTKVPTGTTFVSAASGTVSCSLLGCSDLASGTPCTVSGTTIMCSVPTVKPISSISGFVVKLVVKVTAAPNSTVQDTATVVESNPDPHTGNNSFTTTTKVTKQ